MTLRMALSVIAGNKYVAIIGTRENGEVIDIDAQSYFIEWHHKDILDYNVKSIGAEDSRVVIRIEKAGE